MYADIELGLKNQIIDQNDYQVHMPKMFVLVKQEMQFEDFGLWKLFLQFFYIFRSLQRHKHKEWWHVVPCAIV